MLNTGRKRSSYISQKRERHRLWRFCAFLLVLFFLYNIITAFFFSVWGLHNNTMQPNLQAGDRFVVISAALPQMLAGLRQSDAQFKRGQIVLIDTTRGEGRPWILRAFDSLVRFFTAQQLSIFGSQEHLYIKRLVALPGDEITMNNFVLRIRPADNSHAFTEFELAERPYHPNIPQVPALWDEALPFSGNMDWITLGPGECFVISDDRSNTSDSRTWGPISTRHIIGRPIFRFWPPARMGRP